MKGVRFYEELHNKNRTAETSQGNIVAVFYETPRVQDGDTVFDAAGAVYFEENSPVCGTSVGQVYLSTSCRRVSEKRAREIHPSLFVWLDGDDK
jgi:hypothetical protein